MIRQASARASNYDSRTENLPSLTDLFSRKKISSSTSRRKPRVKPSGKLSSACAIPAPSKKPDQFFELVMEREGKSSTVANGGVAFPHARTDLVERILLGIGRSKGGVTFPGHADHRCTSFSSSASRNKW